MFAPVLEMALLLDALHVHMTLTLNAYCRICSRECKQGYWCLVVCPQLIVLVCAQVQHGGCGKAGANELSVVMLFNSRNEK